MASPLIPTLEMEQGATFVWALCWGVMAVDSDGVAILDADGKKTCRPYDLTTIDDCRMQIRLKSSTEVLVTVTKTDGEIEILPVASASSTSAAIVANTATLTFGADHGLAVGDVIHVDTTDVYGGFHAIEDTPTATTLTFHVSSSDESDSVAREVFACGGNNIEITIPDEKTDLLTYDVDKGKVMQQDVKIYWPDGSEEFVVHGPVTARLRITEDATA